MQSMSKGEKKKIYSLWKKYQKSLGLPGPSFGMDVYTDDIYMFWKKKLNLK